MPHRHSFSQTCMYFQRIYRVQNDGCSRCQINSIMPGDLAWLCVAKLLRWRVAAACKDEDGQSWHTPQGCSAAPRRGRTNPTVYRYTSYRLNTRPGERMTECVFPGRVCASCTYSKAWFFFFFFFLCFSKRLCLCACVGSTGFSLLLPPANTFTATHKAGRVRANAFVCVCVRNADQLCFPPLHKKKKK